MSIVSGVDQAADSLAASSDQNSVPDFARASQARLASSYAPSSSFWIPSIPSVGPLPNSKKDKARKRAAAEAEKQALLDQLKKPSGVSDEEAVRRAIAIIERAVSNGRTEVQVYRFPNTLCTDKGRAINQQEPGWESTLTGVPKE